MTHLIEKKTDFLKNQTRFSEKPQVQTCGCTGSAPIPVQTCGCTQPALISKQISTNIFLKFLKKIKWREIAEGVINLGVKQILLYFSIFVAVGFLINHFVPTSIIVALFSAKSIFAVPLAALIGLPLYVSGESSIPLIKALMAGGASGGAMLAFMITGPGTSAWVVAGIATFLKKRIISLYVLFLLAGGILLGYLYNLLLATGI